jgi:hypothetical protein
LAWLWLLLAIPSLTDVASSFVAGSLLAVGWLVFALAWLLLPLFRPGALGSPAGKQWYLGAAAAGVLGLLLAFTDVGLRLRVAASEPPLRAYAAAVPPGGYGSLHEPHRVGLFLVDGTEERDGVILLYTSAGFLDRYGVAYNPGAKPLPAGRRQLRHLYGPWYSFRWKF